MGSVYDVDILALIWVLRSRSFGSKRMDTEGGAEKKIKKLHFSGDLCLLIVRLLSILKVAEHSDIIVGFISEMLWVSDYFLLEYAVAFCGIGE